MWTDAESDCVRAIVDEIVTHGLTLPDYNK